MPNEPSESALDHKFMREFVEMKKTLADMKTKSIAKDSKPKETKSVTNKGNKPAKRRTKK